MAGAVRFLLFVVVFFGSGQAKLLRVQPDWVRSYDEGMKKAVLELKPVLLDFWASWCGPCLRMDREVYPDGRVVELAADFVFIQVDVDKESAVQAHYFVRALPTQIFLDPFGNEIGRAEGYMKASLLVENLKNIPKDYSALAPLRHELGPQSRNFDALLDAGMVYRRMGLASVGNVLVERALKSAGTAVAHEKMETVYREQGLNYLVLKEEKKAEKIYLQRMRDCEDCPMMPYFLLGLGKTYFQMGNRGKARKVYSDLLQKYPDSQFARLAEEALSLLR